MFEGIGCGKSVFATERYRCGKGWKGKARVGGLSMISMGVDVEKDDKVKQRNSEHSKTSWA